MTAVPERTERIIHTVTGDSEQGKALYATCAACHGYKGQGNEAIRAPKLAGRSNWYLVRQLKNYRLGARGYAMADVPGARMRNASASILESGDVIESVVTYINMLRYTAQ
uniref:Cytochrome c553 n=1 Tax=Candidatus Kentrum eta TaxID=2126337 RepID=A0A450UZK3_9GAMM|nr:MAG: Cytochrome c553 [Candidatus Kentron sp. H]VFJ97988.1 MAG: Cytochrome c553 [Candidatus Kentron sp. H]VFK03127.1 MAG: Cytochrome c553 [Candidatus Kentron sp. H]